MQGERNRPVHSALATDAMFRAIRKKSSILDWRVHEDAGVARGFDPDERIAVRAVRKGAKGQPWIVMYYNTEMVTWNVAKKEQGNADYADPEHEGLRPSGSQEP